MADKFPGGASVKLAQGSASSQVSAAQGRVDALMEVLRNPETRGQYIRVAADGTPYEIHGISLTEEEYRIATRDGIWELLKGRQPASGTTSAGAGTVFADDTAQVDPVTRMVNRAKERYDPRINNGEDLPDVGGDDAVRRLVGNIARITYNADLGDIPNLSHSQENEFERAVHISKRDNALLITRLVTAGPTGGNIGVIAEDTVAVVHTHPGTITAHTPGRGDPATAWLHGISNFVVGRQPSHSYSGSSGGSGSLVITEVGRFNNRTAWWRIGTNGNAGNVQYHPWEGWR